MSQLQDNLRDYIDTLEQWLKECDGNDEYLLNKALHQWGAKDFRYLVLAQTQQAMKKGIELTEDSDWDKVEEETAEKLKVNKPTNMR